MILYRDKIAITINNSQNQTMIKSYPSYNFKSIGLQEEFQQGKRKKALMFSLLLSSPPIETLPALPVWDGGGIYIDLIPDQCLDYSLCAQKRVLRGYFTQRNALTFNSLIKPSPCRFCRIFCQQETGYHSQFVQERSNVSHTCPIPVSACLFSGE